MIRRILAELEIGWGKFQCVTSPDGLADGCSDEILYHAKLHPEQYSDTFSDVQLKQLRESILHICKTAVDLLGDSSKFPEEWLFNHRWSKGKKDAPKSLPSGEKINFLTVGGRTSCVVPSIQKNTGAVARDLKKEKLEDLEDGDEEVETKKAGKGKSRAIKVKRDPKHGDCDESAEKSSVNTTRKRKTPTQVCFLQANPHILPVLEPNSADMVNGSSEFSPPKIFERGMLISNLASHSPRIRSMR